MEQLQNFDLSPTSAFGACLLRFILAGFWIAHWWFKVGYRGMPATEAFFKEQGLPAWLAWFDIRFEVAIAAGLILGIYVPLLCLISLPILFASMWIYRKNGFYSQPVASSFRSCGPARRSPRSSSVQALFASRFRDGCSFRRYSGSCSDRRAATIDPQITSSGRSNCPRPKAISGTRWWRSTATARPRCSPIAPRSASMPCTNRGTAIRGGARTPTRSHAP